MRKTILLILMLTILFFILLAVLVGMNIQKEKMNSSCQDNYVNKTCCQLDSGISWEFKHKNNNNIKVNLSELNLT